MKHEDTIKESILLLLSILTALAVIAGALFFYGNYQRNQFEIMERQTQAQGVLQQAQRIREAIGETESRMKVAAFMLASSKTTPDEEWIKTYMNRISGEDPLVRRGVYISVEKFIEDLSLGRIGDWKAPRTIYDTLMAGEIAYSKISYNQSPEGYFFVTAVPALKDGNLFGVIRYAVSAEALVETKGIPVDSLPTAQFITDSGGKVLYSSGLLDFTGENLGDCLSGGYLVTSAPLDLGGWNLVRFSKGGGIQVISEKLLFGTALLCLIIGAALAGIVSVMVWIIYKKNHNLSHQQMRIASLATSLDALLLEYVPTKDLITLTPGENCGYALENRIIQNCKEYDFKSIHPDDRAKVRKFLSSPKADILEVRMLGKDGQWHWAECQMRPVFLNKKPVSYAGKIFDIHRRKLRELKLLEEKSKDTLTGLLNREAMGECMSLCLNETVGGYLFLFDIDDFESITGAHGHGVGDKVLYKFAKMLRNNFRGTDPVGRIGRDQFAGYMMNTGSRKQAERKAKGILGKLAALSEIEGIGLSASVGIAGYPADGSDYGELFQKAEEALNEAKSRGKNACCFYSGL